MEQYLASTKTIDYEDPLIQRKARELKDRSCDSLDYARNAYWFVRDEITHSWDIRTTIVSRTASDVLKNGTGICWTKACLLAALLRANGIPSGISYQYLARADEDAGEGYIIHALNTIYIQELDQWIRVDARGNKENVNEAFCLGGEQLAFPVRSELGEVDYRDNHPDLDERLVRILCECDSILDVETNFAMA